MLRLAHAEGVAEAAPLQSLTIIGAEGKTITVGDGAGREYARLPAAEDVAFQVGGALGTHTVAVLDAEGQAIDTLTFPVEARTSVDDGGRYGELFRLLYKGMCVYSPDGAGTVTWRGRAYSCFVHWVLDHVHTAKGMQFFHPAAPGLAELMAGAQRADGMIWSFAVNDDGPGYFDTAYGKQGYAWRDGGALFVRQPTENHCEYLHVNLIHLCWKASGDDAWMARLLESARRALDYSVTDPARWSATFGLLKRAYTIDSWDFQVQDEYSPHLGIGNDMRIDVEKTKFGVFYGDNTGYAQACDELAEMLARAGRIEDAQQYRQRGEEMRDRLDRLAWNGRFFTHHIEEDPSVQRDLGVGEATQVSLSHCYSVNRGLTQAQCRAIFETYLEMKDNAPPGSPGEWYAIYPPFGRGFGDHSKMWRYMNGGVAGHAAGELARGAFAHGFEAYGADILSRLLDLGNVLGGGSRIWFSYTGAFPPAPPPPVWTPVSLADAVNMDLWDVGGPKALPWMTAGEAGNDVRGLPVGAQTFAAVPFQIADPNVNGRRAALAVSQRPDYPAQADVPVNAPAAAIYLLHTAGSVGPEGIAGAVTFCYEDGTEAVRYLMSGKHLTGWWFPRLSVPEAGIAWHGPSPVSADVGVCWAALANPHSDKTIAGLRLSAPLDGGIYALLGVTLSDRPHYAALDAVALAGQDTGGPDNWAAGTAMLALTEGLAGVADRETAFRRVRLSPRWPSAAVPNAAVTVRYTASTGYVAYHYAHDPDARQIMLTLTGSGEAIDCHVLLPLDVLQAQTVTLDGQPVPFEMAQIEDSAYADFVVTLPAVQTIVITY